MKKVLGIYGSPNKHWVGDGFPVRSLFSYSTLGQHISPFLLLDYAGPADFPPSTHRRGVGQHPHRGFETVTIVYEGELEHRDSTGAGGKIGPGDVQWMTAASGILHEEYHSPEFSRKGGTLEMVQLWVNLPAKDKMAVPRYQTILNQDITQVGLPNDAGQLRVIAGEYSARKGPALTFTPIDVWDIRLNAGKKVSLQTRSGFTCAIVLLSGTVQINGIDMLQEAQLALLDPEGSELLLEASRDAKLVLISGEPIDEPIVGYGPFVMNTNEEIARAMQDFDAGDFGQIHP
ncbi:pirin family protein [Pseudomonas sp. PCH199]|uniref:pirin family protein n=1 Tax=unclassified Pseudomonas TaxID=196821 RepID=UPI000BCBD6B7|nr:MULTISPECIES: pirin family protein [unclassified Pseudomonas]MCW8279249.1 pirin family protein [Pseudomonas sp. PCH199]PAM78470.1 quercetin 2,3-dioxygenase [Pseudomonas sp. ERMR1:02]